MATKHTEGPWFHEQIGEFFSVRNIEDGEWNVICETLLSDPEDEANARLIAESPALLICLSQIMAALPVSRDWLDPDLERNAKATIRKAEGAL